jgi:hypothetical protein
MDRGLSNAEIARELTLSEATANTHVARIFMTLNLRDRAQAVVMAYETGLVSRGPASKNTTASQAETPGFEPGRGYKTPTALAVRRHRPD